MKILKKTRILATYLLVIVLMMYTFSVYEAPVAKEASDDMPAIEAVE